MPARAPASIAMLQMDMRASMERASMTSPQNSMTWPVPPAVPMMPMMWRITSFEFTPSASLPLTLMRMFFWCFIMSVCVASTCSTSEVPMPNASAPKAPCVEVWLSPHTRVVPGSVKPCSGPMTWTMPCRLSSMPKNVSPKALTLSSRVTTCVLASSSEMKLLVSLKPFRVSVGMLWSTVASVQSGRRTSRPPKRRPSKA
mmetsp:Transcript_15577/g.49250  ORF Transcript_15577/g.49250 Transcript_15577/m.49250 type:complete len:200 (-) Transcript_15577:223-822(-)